MLRRSIISSPNLRQLISTSLRERLLIARGICQQLLSLGMFSYFSMLLHFQNHQPGPCCAWFFLVPRVKGHAALIYPLGTQAVYIRRATAVFATRPRKRHLNTTKCWHEPQQKKVLIVTNRPVTALQHRGKLFKHMQCVGVKLIGYGLSLNSWP